MTVQATPRKAGPFVGNGVSTVFAFSFKTRSADHLKVIRADLDGVETTLLLNSQYTVALNADQEAMPGGSVTLSAPLALNYKLTILSLVPYAQTTDVPGSGVIPPAVLEDTLDLLVMQTQQLAEESTRTVKVSPTSGANPDTLLPDAVAATAASASAASSSATAAADSASAASTSAGTASSAATAASASASAASTSATNAASSATSAAASASNAATSASAAATSASDLASAWRATSTSSLAIGTGSKTFATQSGKLFEVGSFVTIAHVGTPTDFMFGQVTAYSGTSLTVSVALASGAGTFADWTITVSGARGADGAVTSVTAGDGTITVGGTASAPTVRVAAGVFQPLDAELSAIAGLTSAADRLPYFTGSGAAALAPFTAAGRALVDDADAAAQRATLGLVIGTNVQAYDAELQALAGLTSAADRLPYFTGAGAAALATFTAAGRALVDDADAAAQRATLGLGTAATYNTGTSGAVVPLLSGANTWTSNQQIGDGTGTSIITISGAPGANLGLSLNKGGSQRWFLYSSSVAESGSNAGSDLTLNAYSDTGAYIGAVVVVKRSDGSILVGNPTGSFKGFGTINAQAVYDDNTLLTCYILEAEATGAVDLNKWDALVPNGETPAIPDETQVVTKLIDQPAIGPGGAPVFVNGAPLMTKVPTEVVEVVRPATPAQEIVRTHEPARRFAARAEMMLDPKQYGEFWKANGHLPSMPSPDEWVAADHKLSTGDLIQRLWEVVEVQTVHIEKLRQRIETLEAKLP